MTVKDGFPVKFNNPNDSCDSFDQREYCQMVQQFDNINFSWTGDIITENLIECCYDFNTCACSTGETCEGLSGPPSANPWTQHGVGMTCGRLLDIPGDFSTPGNILCFGDGSGTLATTADYLSMSNVISAAGTYKVIVTISGAPNSDYYQGSFTVQLGNAVSAVTAVSAGTFTFYLSPTALGDLKIIPDAALFCLDSVEVYEICTDYSISIFDKDGGFIKNITNNITSVGETFFYKSTWDAMSLDNGCYYFCIIKECESDNSELVFNGSFSGTDPWQSVGGTGWIVSAGTANHTGALADDYIRQTINIDHHINYLITIDVSGVGASGSVTIQLGGNVVATITANGSYQYTVYTDVLSNSYISITGLNTISIDNVSVKEAEVACSTCYALDDEHECTKLLTWTNDDDGFGIPYSSVSFTNYLRIRAFVEKPRYPQEVDRFAFSDGTRKILYASGEKIWTLFMDYLPEYLHDAIANGKIHDHFYIDGVEYICTSDEYQPEWRSRLKLAQGKIEIQKVVDNNKNKNC